MKTKKSLVSSNKKSNKMKILLATLIPLGVLVVATAIIVPVAVTQCSSPESYDEENWDTDGITNVTNDGPAGGYVFLYYGGNCKFGSVNGYQLIVSGINDHDGLPSMIHTKNGKHVTIEGVQHPTTKLKN
ncbi:hypothetical protein FACS189459_1130 [Bacilli bacterium]|nr:hypothetical protein FACS189459_1130 [Bacilli bacterium]